MREIERQAAEGWSQNRAAQPQAAWDYLSVEIPPNRLRQPAREVEPEDEYGRQERLPEYEDLAYGGDRKRRATSSSDGNVRGNGHGHGSGGGQSQWNKGSRRDYSSYAASAGSSSRHEDKKPRKDWRDR